MTWPATKEAVRLAVASCLSLPDYLGADGLTTIHQVEWENKRSANRMVGSIWTDLSLTSVQVHGQDEARRVDVTVGSMPEVATSYGGNRLMSVTVRICSDSQEDADEAVGELAERLRLRFRQPASQAILQPAGVALVGFGSTFEADYRDQNGRIVSCAIIELRLSSVALYTDLGTVGEYVESVEGEAEGDLTCNVTLDVSCP